MDSSPSSERRGGWVWGDRVGISTRTTPKSLLSVKSVVSTIATEQFLGGQRA